MSSRWPWASSRTQTTTICGSRPLRRRSSSRLDWEIRRRTWPPAPRASRRSCAPTRSCTPPSSSCRRPGAPGRSSCRARSSLRRATRATATTPSRCRCRPTGRALRSTRTTGGCPTSPPGTCGRRIRSWQTWSWAAVWSSPSPSEGRRRRSRAGAVGSRWRRPRCPSASPGRWASAALPLRRSCRRFPSSATRPPSWCPRPTIGP
mmetsp:Transcript_76909/g.229218  ORF Transcript_76909/g.229218 Transcript_76909/m.229218 type:complete len:205 (-) Transcript_76909:234-848(-)